MTFFDIWNAGVNEKQLRRAEERFISERHHNQFNTSQEIVLSNGIPRITSSSQNKDRARSGYQSFVLKMWLNESSC